MKWIARFACLCAAVVLVLTPLGCVTTDTESPAFTHRWSKEVERYNNRKGKTPQGIPLSKKGARVKAKIAVDEEGKPKLQLGGEEGVSADVNVSGGDAKVKLKYKKGWGNHRRVSKGKK